MILGDINPAHLVGGAVKLNAARSFEVFEERIAHPLGLSLADAAYGAHLIAASNMIRAIKAVSSALLALALGLTFGLRAPMPAGLSLIGLGTMGFVMSIFGRLALASHLAYRAKQLGLGGGRAVGGAVGTRSREECRGRPIHDGRVRPAPRARSSGGYAGGASWLRMRW